MTRCPVVSQNGLELYISMSEYDHQWVDYVSKNRVGIVVPVPAANMATLRTYGPWRIDNARHMERFIRIMMGTILAT